MVRTKPDLFLMVPNSFDANCFSREDLITPPCYIVTSPPPLLTPTLSRSSSLSTNTSQSESDLEFDDDVEVPLRTDAAPWTQDQDEALLSVHLFARKANSDLLVTFGWTSSAISAVRSITTATKFRRKNFPHCNSRPWLARVSIGSLDASTST